MKVITFLLIGIIGALGDATPNSRQSKTMPQCIQGESCIGAFCICCGDCTKATEYKCKVKEGMDCSRIELTVTGDVNSHRLTPEERKAGSDFFKTAMSYMNDSWNWDNQN